MTRPLHDEYQPGHEWGARPVSNVLHRMTPEQEAQFQADYKEVSKSVDLMNRPLSGRVGQIEDAQLEPTLQAIGWLTPFMAGMLVNSLLWAAALLLRAAGIV